MRSASASARKGSSVSLIFTMLTLLTLIACTDTQSRKPVILGDRLIQSYDLSCKSCHEVHGSGAPLAHDKEAWDQRLKMDISELIQSTLEGKGAMPPLGQCFECDERDIEKLIWFMASPPKG